MVNLGTSHAVTANRVRYHFQSDKVPLGDGAQRAGLMAGAGWALGDELLPQAPKGLRLVRDHAHLWGARSGQQPRGGNRISMQVQCTVCEMLSQGRPLRVRL